MYNAVVTVDTREGAMQESGDIVLSKVQTCNVINIVEEQAFSL